MRKFASTLRPPTAVALRARTGGRKRAAGSLVATAVLAAVATVSAPAPATAAPVAAAPSAAPLATTTLCNPLPISLPAPANRHTSAKKAWAYYFPPFPLSVDADPLRDSYNNWFNSHNSTGGAYDLRDRPQLRQRATQTNWRQVDFEQEVRQAVDAGLDGFIWEYHTSSDVRWNQLPAMLAAAKAVDPGFKIMLSPDFNLAAGSTSDSVYNDVMKVKDDPAIYRNAAGIVLAPFYPERKTPSWWDGLRSRLASSGVKTNLVPIFITWGGGTQKMDWNNSVSGYSEWGTRIASNVPVLAKESAEAHRRGKTYMQPVAFEDSRAYAGKYWESSNSSTLRDSLMTAINSNADSVALMTWNDYTESWVAPSKQRGYAVMDMAAYYISWFKSGVKPTVTQDALYWNHRSQTTNAPYSKTPLGRNGKPAPMFIPNGDAAKNEVELVAVLKTPGRLTITQGSNVKTMDAPAGLTSFKVPLVAGTTPSFKLSRSGTTVQTVTSNAPVRSSVVYQDMIYHAGGGVAAACAR
ncbi:endo-1,3-alpha-glucanase family glycosylhydrolase [Arthrobacter sp. NPDC058192]|uniref:endo-1,3-alpha-glucanase family glycosylhydrolase n=1 Tax=Arthrobacter sp. NPDC058192 TaxID=3346372 RepID=UPI0036EF32F6